MPLLLTKLDHMMSHDWKGRNSTHIPTDSAKFTTLESLITAALLGLYEVSLVCTDLRLKLIITGYYQY